jgi:hypothetical protein
VLTRLVVRNFKQFDEVDIELGNPVVFVGPNDSGKTSALQVLTLWDLGLRRWSEKRSGGSTPEERPGVAINRRDLSGIPAPTARQLWHDLHVRNTFKDDDGRQQTENVRIDVVVSGVTDGRSWSCGLEFDYTNEEAFYCRPLRTPGGTRMAVPDEARAVRVALLGPMSGLAANETKLEPGAVNVRIGEGRTAEVLRNLCYQVLEGRDGEARWDDLRGRIERLFGTELDRPRLVVERGEIDMAFRNHRNVKLDLSSAGRGMQQTLLLLAFLALNPGSVVLLDEPDAHLEILRQRQTYQLLSDAAQQSGSQVVIASHSEVILNEAADRDVVVAFVGRPHRIDDRGSQVLKSLKEIGFEEYYQAELTGFVLYVEGSTDLAILLAFARQLGHAAASLLEAPFVHYVGNQPNRAREHFFGVREAKIDLVGLALFDRIGRRLEDESDLVEVMWQRREIENYLCQPETLLAYARSTGVEEFPGPLLEELEAERRTKVMDDCIADRVPPAALRDRNDRFWIDTKASDDLLDPVFADYFERLELPNLLRKSDYHRLAEHVPREQLSPEVSSVLDRIVAVASGAKPRGAKS